VLVYAAGHKKPELVTLLLEKGADVNCRLSAEEGTALSEAALNGDLKLVSVLLDRGSNPNVITTEKDTGKRISLAAVLCSNGHSDPVYTDILGKLIQHGAEVDAPDYLLNPNFVAPVVVAALAGDLPKVKLLIASGARFTSLQLGIRAMTPLAAATQTCRKEIIAFLTEEELKKIPFPQMLSNRGIKGHNCEVQ
jgi:ankyrin repeat protein